MRRFRFDDMIVEEAAPDFQDILANARRRQIRPLCLCREPGVSMYIARVADQYVVKRMPLSGGGHDSTCASYEPPDDLSGLGALVGNAIQVDGDTGMSALKLGFSLTKVGPRARQVAGSGDSATAVMTRKLSLCSMLNYLWHQAELTAWMSRWTGKRQWWNIRWHLLEAARQMTVRDAPLSDVLFVPEPFRAADKAALEKRQAAALSGALPPRTGPRKLMVLIGEIKKFEPMRNGQRMLIKHLPDLPFMLHDKLYSRLLTRFENEFALSDGDQSSHLLAIATFGLTSAGLAIVEEMALMVVNENWVPYETVYEKKLLDALAGVRERSIKGLRYALAPDAPIASVLLQKQQQPVALYIVPATADDEYEEKLRSLISSRPEIGAWIWRIADGGMPSLPS
ncbi:DUF1173 domain-containing protein [Brucella intermedia]|uniref:DUF1173 domain-containing protein n=1 Tax=Brucella intermedia TaxID=94625 RepID=UPI0004689D2D|nr:DUF1173 domain-containing protein [Brucella intermedia]